MPEAPYVLPEFTRSLRALAVPSAPGSDHDRIFAPLIQARASAHRVQSLEAQVAAFDAARIERAWREAIAALGADRHPRSAPDRRALASELEELGAPVWAALARVQAAAGAARIAPVEGRRVAWERWVGTIRTLFEAADDWWRAALPVLGDARGRRGALWRRVLRRGA
jgi:hypothetical protein